MRIGAVGDVRRYVFGLRKIVSYPATVGKLREYIATYVAARYSGGIPFECSWFCFLGPELLHRLIVEGEGSRAN
jgi:hypothetical protein